jgi:hypothetical protein
VAGTVDLPRKVRSIPTVALAMFVSVASTFVTFCGNVESAPAM